jgi:cyclase
MCVNTQAVDHPEIVRDGAALFGSQSIVVSIDVKKGLLGKYRVVVDGGRRRTKLDPVGHAVAMADAGAGEILVNAVDRDGTMTGYDLELLTSMTAKVPVPVIACGGAGSLGDFQSALEGARVSAVAAGSFFVFKGKHRAVLISYPTRAALKDAFGRKDGRLGIREMGR